MLFDLQLHLKLLLFGIFLVGDLQDDRLIGIELYLALSKIDFDNLHLLQGFRQLPEERRGLGEFEGVLHLDLAFLGLLLFFGLLLFLGLLFLFGPLIFLRLFFSLSSRRGLYYVIGI